MTKKGISSLITVLTIFTLFLGVNITHAAQYVMKCGYFDPPDPFTADEHAMAVVVKNIVEARTNGQIAVELYPAGVMGKEREQMELLKANVIQWHVASVGSLGTFFPEIATFDIPFAFSSHAVAYEVCDGWYGREIGEAIRKKIPGVRLVGICEAGGFYALTNNVRPIRTPDDMRGLKIRTMTVPGQMRMMKSWGAAPTPMPWAELYTGLQTGVVQGQQNPVPILVHGKLYEVQKYVTLLDHLWGTDWVLMNETWLQSLPEHFRNIVLEAIKTSIVAGRGVNRLVEATDRGVEFLKKKGLEVYSPTPEEREMFRKLAQPAVMEYIKETLGDSGIEWVNKLLRAAKEAEEKVHTLPK